MEPISLPYPVSRSHMAFIFAVHRLMEGEKCLYFWTFTFSDVPWDDVAMDRWHRLIGKITKAFRLVKGVRVVEVHPGNNIHGLSHGLHFHALFNQRICVRWMREAAWQCHFGRVDVQKADLKGCLYLGKYLTKGQPDLAKGMRRWGAVNWPECTRVRDVEIESQFTRNIQEVQYQAKLNQLSTDIVHSVYVNTRLFGDYKDWPLEKFYYGQKAKKFFEEDDWRTYLGANTVDSDRGYMSPKENKLTREQSMQNVAVYWRRKAQWIAKQRGLTRKSGEKSA